MARRSGRLEGGSGWAVVRRCPSCGRIGSECRCPSGATTSGAGRPVVRLRIEKRQGKAVTVAATEGLDDAALASLVRELRQALATGGTLRGPEMELQGDHRERLREALRAKGLVVKG